MYYHLSIKKNRLALKFDFFAISQYRNLHLKDIRIVPLRQRVEIRTIHFLEQIPIINISGSVCHTTGLLDDIEQATNDLRTSKFRGYFTHLENFIFVREGLQNLRRVHGAYRL